MSTRRPRSCWCGLRGYPFGSIATTRSRAGTGSPRPVGRHAQLRRALARPVFRIALRNNASSRCRSRSRSSLPLVLAYLIHQRIPGWRFFRSTFFLPAIYSTIVLGILARPLLQLDGPSTRCSARVGLGALEREWLGARRPRSR